TSSYGTNPNYHGVFAHAYDAQSGGYPRMYTETATVTTTDGRAYVATATNTVTAGSSPNMSLNYLVNADGGQSFGMTVLYSDPSHDPVTGYTVDWGDGQVDSSSSPTFSHSYPYDNVNYGDPENGHYFT